MMPGDTSSTPSLLYTASCFKNNDHTEDITGDNMKQPLIIMSNKSLKAEEQTQISKERPSRSILCIQSFLFGSFIVFAFQGIVFAACSTTLVKLFGKDPPTPSAPGLLLQSSLSYYFVLSFQLVIFVILVAVWMRSIYTIMKSGSLYIRSSIWTERMLLIFLLYFAVGALVGSVSLWTIVLFLSTGIMLPWPPVLGIMIMITWVLFLITVECFEWRSHNNWEQTTKHELEDDSGLLPWCEC
jgi:hypothetical protein